MTATQTEDEVRAKSCAALLRVYPAQWRANERGEDMLSALFDSTAAAGRLRPTVADSANVIAHGLLARTASLNYVIPPAARRHIAQVSLAAGGGLALFLLAGGEIALPGWSDGPSPRHLDFFLRPHWGPFLTFGVVGYALWLINLGFYAAGRIRTSREIAVLTGAITLALPVLADVAHRQRPPGGMLATLAVLAFGAAALPLNSRISGRSRSVVPMCAIALGGLMAWWRWTNLNRPGLYFPRTNLTSRTMFYWNPSGDHYQINRALAGPATWIAIAATVLAIAISYRDRSWIPAALFLLIPAMTLRLGTSQFNLHPSTHTTRDVLLGVTGAVIAVVAYGVVIARLLRVPRTRTRRPRRNGSPTT